MSDEDKPESYDDLLEYALELEKQLEEKDVEIAELSKQQIGRGRGRRSGNEADLASLQLELRELQDKYTIDQKRYNEDLAASAAKINITNEEKLDLERKSLTLAKKVEELEIVNRELSKKTQHIELQSKEFNKQKTVNIKMSQQLTDENETLKEEVSY
jgi:hypothetical protein